MEYKYFATILCYFKLSLDRVGIAKKDKYAIIAKYLLSEKGLLGILLKDS